MTNKVAVRKDSGNKNAETTAAPKQHSTENDHRESAEKKRPKTYQMLSRRIIALALTLWFFAMALLTWAVAEDMYIQLEDRVREYAFSFNHSREANLSYPDDLPGTLESGIIRQLGYPYFILNLDQLLPIVLPQTPSSYSSDNWFWGKWDLMYGFEPALLYYDETSGSVLTSGNYLTFAYTPQESWAAGSAEIQGLGYIDLDTVEGGMETFSRLIGSHPSGALGINLYLSLLRLEGYFEGNEFHPVTIDRGDYTNRYTGDSVRDSEELCRLDADDKLEWNNLLTVEENADRQTETIYAWDFDGIIGNYEPLAVNGTSFDGLPELLEAHFSSELNYEKKNLLESVIIQVVHGREDSYGPFRFALAVRCWPLQYAALRLIPAYLVSLLLVAAMVWLILRKIRTFLIEPLEYLVRSIDRGTYLPPCASWHEPYLLEKYYADSRQAQAESKTELQQVRTALDYAKHAEENRRQLVSNITHELKTPLAVIHSYAEGLQAGIAAEKQDQYLSVILEETERMDAMVLQMLDLSRLEAGKVRLAADQFSLLQLTQSVAEKFAPMMEAKELTMSYGLTEDFLLTADEGRIAQVVTNLLSNAVKYTAPGGRILINVYSENHGARFSIVNTAKHLPYEALSKIWDSFYRADPSRTEPGTGLGLTLVKSIVELHQGSCYVRNTVDKTVEPAQNAVEFGFTLPLT